MLFCNNLYSQNPPKRLVIGNITIEEGEVYISGTGADILIVESVSEVASFSPERRETVKKLIISGTNASDLTGIKTTGADNGTLPNLESIELQNMTEVPDLLLFAGNDNNWLESFFAPEATNIGSSAFNGCSALTEINLPEVEIIRGSVFAYCDALRKLTLGGTSVQAFAITFDYLNTNQVDLYLSAEEMQSGSVTGNKWTKDGTTWTFKSIQQIVP